MNACALAFIAYDIFYYGVALWQYGNIDLPPMIQV